MSGHDAGPEIKGDKRLKAEAVMDNSSVVINGAGIAGLAAAHSLTQQGWGITLCESKSTLNESGAGIQLGPHSLKLLAHWGLLERLRPHAHTPEQLRIRDIVSGKMLHSLRLGAAVQSRYGAPYWCVQRSDLHAVLWEAVQLHPRIELHTNSTLESLQETGQEGLSWQRTGNKAVHTAAALLFCDGIAPNRLRTHYFPHTAHNRFSGHCAFRALIPRADLPSYFSRDIGVWWGQKVHLVHYPIAGGALINLVLIVEGEALAEDAGWNAPISSNQLQERINRALQGSALAADFQRCIGSVAQWAGWSLYGRSPQTPWVRGPIALLGDAAHPMLPYLAQGAAMAMEDAAVLAHCLGAPSANRDAAAALLRYQNLRHARSVRVVQTAERNGRIFHAHGALAWMRNQWLHGCAAQDLAPSWLYGWQLPESDKYP